MADPIRLLVPKAWAWKADGEWHPILKPTYDTHEGEAGFRVLLLHPDGSVTWEEEPTDA